MRFPFTCFFYWAMQTVKSRKRVIESFMLFSVFARMSDVGNEQGCRKSYEFGCWRRASIIIIWRRRRRKSKHMRWRLLKHLLTNGQIPLNAI